MIALDWRVLLIQAISFLITLWLIKRIGWVPLIVMLADRQQKISSDYEKADAERRQMESLRREYDEKIRGAEAEARTQIASRMQNAESQANQVLSRAQEDARALIERAHAEVERDRQKVLAELRGQVAHLSVAVAGKIIDERLDESRHRGLVDDFINRLGALS